MVSRHNSPFAGKRHYHIRIYITLSHIKVCELTSLKEGHISFNSTVNQQLLAPILSGTVTKMVNYPTVMVCSIRHFPSSY